MKKNNQTILLTGSTGYIGRRLKHKLLESGCRLKLLVRQPKALSREYAGRVEIIQGGTFDPVALKTAMAGVDTAYYLIHSLGSDDYAALDRRSAENFREAAIAAGVKKIIYLGGLGLKNTATSEHLRSRIETGEVLCTKPDAIDVIWFRAGVIIGSGSASFEIIRNLIQKLPVMVTPRWVRTLAQPIGVDDVIAYLDAAKAPDLSGSHVVDIGTERLCYQDMMRRCAEIMGLKRSILPVPFLSIGLSSYWLGLFTPVPFKVARALIEGLKSEVVVQNDRAAALFPQIRPAPFEACVRHALHEIEENQVISRWNDRGGEVWDDAHARYIEDAIFVDRQTRPLGKVPAGHVFNAFCSIGGENGWFAFNFLWQIRGAIDKLMGGTGLNRGRRNSSNLRIGDTLDFWKVVDVQPDRRLLLYAQMKVPGKAWLEFKLDSNTLIQSAYFLPMGVWGRLYWYSLIPLHFLVFGNMIDAVLKKAETRE